jgi:hypothetical protein
VARHPSSAESIEYDPGDERVGREGALEHLARRGIRAKDIEQVFKNDPYWQRNKKGRRANWRMIGYTDGGRALDIKVFWDEDRGALLPITGWALSQGDRRKYPRRGGGR